MEKIKFNAATKLNREDMKKITGGVAQPSAGWVCYNYIAGPGGAVGAYTTWNYADTAAEGDALCHSGCASTPGCVFSCGGPSCD